MSKGLLFWILMILWFLSWFAGMFVPAWPIWGSNALMFVLLALLGWHNFGPPIQ